MNPEAGKFSIDVPDRGPLPGHSHKQLAIPAGTILRIESARIQKRLTPEKRGLLQPPGSAKQITPHREISSLDVPDLPSFAINDVSISERHVAFRVLPKKICDPLQRPRR
jgi:hypothetical protein